MTQTTSQWDIPSNGDIQARQPMNWQTQDADLHEFFKKIIQKRIKSSFSFFSKEQEKTTFEQS